MPVNVIVRRWLTLLTLASTVDFVCLLFGLVDLNFDDFFARSSCIVQPVVKVVMCSRGGSASEA